MPNNKRRRRRNFWQSVVKIDFKSKSIIPYSVNFAQLNLTQVKQEFIDIKEEPDEKEVDELVNTDSIYVCYVCNDEKKLTKIQLRLHFKKAHKGKRMASMRLHKDYVIKCEICGKMVTSKKLYKNHMERHSNEFICETCGVCFKKFVDYTIHLRLHSTENHFKCSLCKYTTDGILEIKEHIKGVHSKKSKYTCLACRKVFPILTWLKQHENYHQDIRPYKCDVCKKRFTYARYVTVHKNKDHRTDLQEPNKKPYQCVICKNRYTDPTALNRHMNIHSGNLAVCDLCGKRFLDNNKLKIHKRTHTGEKPYCCTDCGKCFISRERLKEHERVHTGEKPFKCKECGRGFTQRSPLKVHTRTHTGERPYICRLCNKGFISGGSLNAHLKKCEGIPSN